MMFTTAHPAVGLQSQPPTWYMIARAVEHGVIERADFGWNRVAYGPLRDGRGTAKPARALCDERGLR
jgi:hypothetical protein